MPSATESVAPSPTSYYSYFSGVPMPGAEVWVRPARVYINFPTNDGLTCVAMQAPIAGFHDFRSDIEGNFYRALAEVPELALRVRAGKRAERWSGSADVDNFFRTPHGPGWALVGDAGYQKDPILAQGISDAFRDAELLATAIHAGFTHQIPLEAALSEYERQRNEAALPGYEQTCAAASFTPPPQELMEKRSALHTAPPVSSRGDT
ncbi:MAG: NAD(P)/FAD-dependent oxidoreductase [Actinomycetes bacterium]